MKIDEIDKMTSVVLTIIFIVVLFVAFLATEKEVEELETEVKILQQQKEELEKGDGRETILPTVIDCENELREGDIKIKIIMKLYNPFGEWIEITEENVEYQLKYGGRIIQCLEKGGDE